MQRTIRSLAFVAILGTFGAAGFGPPGGGIALVPMPAAVTTLRYTGDLGGVKADAIVSFERLPDYLLAAGLIQSTAAKYRFSAEIYGDSGFGTILDLNTGISWQIKLQLFSKGFTLISNPLGPGSPSTYYFKLVERK